MQPPQSPNQNLPSPFDRPANGPVDTSVVPINYTEGVPAPSPYFPYERQDQEESSLNLRELWRKVKRRKWLILAIVAIATTMTAVEAARQKNIYQATATIEVGNNSQMLLKTADLVIESDNSDIETALFLLTSYPLLEDVAANLKLEQNQVFLNDTEELSYWDVIKNKLSHSSQAQKVEDERREVAQLDQVVLESRTPEESNRLAPFVNMIRGGLKAQQVRDARLIKVSFTHTNPEIAALVANGVAQTYIEKSYKKKTSRFTDTSEWLSKSTRELQAQVQKAEQDLANYTRANGIFSTEGKEDLTGTKLAHLHDQAMRAETDRLIKQSLFEEVRQGRVAQLPEAFANQATSDLQKRLSELTVANAQLAAKYGTDNPRMVEVQQQRAALQEEISKTREQLAEKLRADYERAQRDENSLKAALNRAKAEAVQQNQTAIQYNILKQNVETSKTLYTDFLQKTRQADVERAQQTRDALVAEPARKPGGPIGPDRARTVMLALILSLAGGIGLVFLLDHLDNTIKTVDDVSRYVRLPALGVIPAIATPAARRMGGRRSPQAALNSPNGTPATSPTAQATNALTQSKDASSIAEAYRMLRTSILLAAAGQPPKTILITSSQPAEGKTTTISNTAICLSQLGAKVLVIDADMRRPRIHKTFGLQPKRGLSTYLSSDVPLQKVVQPSGIPNLWVMTAGIVPPNSADLLSSERMRRMLQKLSEHFDHILIDSPPVSSVTDPVILSRLVDGVIMVIHGGKSSRELVSHARQELQNVGAKIFGVVLNNVSLDRDGYDYYYYRRYQYEYGRDTARAAVPETTRESGRLDNPATQG